MKLLVNECPRLTTRIHIYSCIGLISPHETSLDTIDSNEWYLQLTLTGDRYNAPSKNINNELFS